MCRLSRGWLQHRCAYDDDDDFCDQDDDYDQDDVYEYEQII